MVLIVEESWEHLELKNGIPIFQQTCLLLHSFLRHLERHCTCVIVPPLKCSPSCTGVALLVVILSGWPTLGNFRSVAVLMDCSQVISVVVFYGVGIWYTCKHCTPWFLFSEGPLQCPLCLVSLQGTPGPHGLYLAILQDTAVLWCLCPEMPCSDLWKTPSLIVLFCGFWTLSISHRYKTSDCSLHFISSFTYHSLDLTPNQSFGTNSLVVLTWQTHCYRG